MAMVLVLMRLVEPSSELLSIAPTKVNDDRLYRALDQVRLHKEALEKYLKERLGELFHLDYLGNVTLDKCST